MAEIVGSGLSGCLSQATQLAEKNFPVFIVGDTGTGKELVADAYAEDWCRKKGVEKEKKYARLNCTGLSDDLLAAELFGYVKGAFTDAAENREGLVQNHDLILLDELGDASALFQAAILRLAETGDYKRVGARTIEPWSGRLIASTNRPKNVRHDLVQRFHWLELPCLAMRPDDIVALVLHFGEKFGVTSFAERFAKFAALYTWPGNVRELLRWLKEASLTGCADIPEGRLCPPNPRLPIRYDLALDGHFASESTNRVELKGFSLHFYRHRPLDWMMEQNLVAEQYRQMKEELPPEFHLGRIADVLEQSTPYGRQQRSVAWRAPELAHLWKHDVRAGVPPDARAWLVDLLKRNPKRLPAVDRQRLGTELSNALTRERSIRGLARWLGVPESTVRDRIKALGIKHEE
ncbi:MAG: sigma 54-interacting transcriptional regulator [Candidatus Binatia bacterium]|jgi:DNA-binding NtrC family response regulator